MVPESFESQHKRFPIDGTIFKASLLTDGNGVGAMVLARRRQFYKFLIQGCPCYLKV